MSIVRNIGNMMQVSENQTINFNKDIVMTVPQIDGTEQSIIVCRLYCTIVASKSIQYYMDVENADMFERMKDTIQVEIDRLMSEVIMLRATLKQMSKEQPQQNSEKQE